MIKNQRALTPRWTAVPKFLLQSVFLLFLTYSSFAQQSIGGKISDEKGEPVPGATVQVKGTNRTVSTDQQGNFTLSAPSASSKLVVSFVGYEPKEIAVASKSIMNVSLVRANANKGEVVVVGYGTQRKS